MSLAAARLRCVELAPLHNPPAVAAIEEARRALPDVPHVAVFDTAFHATIPAVATTYLLPERFRERWASAATDSTGSRSSGSPEQVPVARLVVCHLGGGCSVTAVRDGRSVDTTMGFTPLEGVPMATRAGLGRPRRTALPAAPRRDARPSWSTRSSTSPGCSALGGTGDVAALIASSDEGARSRSRSSPIASPRRSPPWRRSLGGLDALAFTGGIGENAEPVRAAICERLRFLGVGERVPVHVIAAREDAVVARAVRAAIAR